MAEPGSTRKVADSNPFKHAQIPAPTFELPPLFKVSEGWPTAWRRLIEAAGASAEVFGDYDAPMPVVEDQILMEIKPEDKDKYGPGKLNLVEESRKAGLGTKKVHDFSLRHGRMSLNLKQTTGLCLLLMFYTEDMLQQMYPYWKHNGIMLDVITRLPFVIQHIGWVMRACSNMAMKEVNAVVKDFNNKLKTKKVYTKEQKEKFIKDRDSLIADQSWKEDCEKMGGALERWARYCMKRWWSPHVIDQYPGLEGEALADYIPPTEVMANNVKGRFTVDVSVAERLRIKNSLLDEKRMPIGEDIFTDALYNVKLLTAFRAMHRYASLSLAIPFCYDTCAVHNVVDPDTNEPMYKAMDLENPPPMRLHFKETIKATGYIANTDYNMQQKESIWQQLSFPLMTLSFAVNYFVPDLMYQQILDYRIRTRRDELEDELQNPELVKEIDKYFDVVRTQFHKAKIEAQVEAHKQRLLDSKGLD